MLQKVLDFLMIPINALIEGFKALTDWLGLTSYAADENADRMAKANEKVSESSKKRADKLSEGYNQEVAMAKIAGKDMNGISFDEAAFEPHLLMIYQEVLNLRRLSTGGPLHFIGTPSEGINDYAELWERGNPENPSRDDKFISFRLSTRDNVGYGLTQNNFDDVIRQQAEYLIPQNIDGYFIEARDAFFWIENTRHWLQPKSLARSHLS